MAAVKVIYKGLSDIREVSAAHLKRRGISVSKDLVWSSANNFAVMVDGSDELISLLKAEGHFSVSEVKDDNADGAAVIDAEDLSESGELVDGNTGARTTAKK